MSFHSHAHRRAPIFRTCSFLVRHRTTCAAVVLSIATIVVFSVPVRAGADDLSFDALYEKAEYFRFRGLWSQSIACYKKALLKRSTEFGYLTHCVEAVVARDPFNPDGHIALGLAFQNSLEPHLSQSGILTDFGQSEFEYKQAISLSPNQVNEEAAGLLNQLSKLKSAAKARNKTRNNIFPIRDAERERANTLLLSRWTPPKNPRFYLTRIKVECDSYRGDVRAVVEVPSSSPEHDEIAINACQSVLDDFRFTNWSGRHIQFASENDKKWVEFFEHGNTGTLASLMYKEEPIGNVRDVASEYITSRWSESRIKDYCRSDTQLPRCMQCLPPVGGRAKIVGDFALQLPEQLRPAIWTVGVVCARPVKIVAVAARGKWRLEYGSIQEAKCTDDEFLMHRVNDAIFLSLRKYELAHVNELDHKWIVRSRAKVFQESLVRSQKNKIVAYKCRLADGAEVTVNLKDSSEIETILVNGHPDAAWNEAYKQRDESLAILDKLTPEPER